jgi:glycosyltransferase involved in cell wall biosynthesis
VVDSPDLANRLAESARQQAKDYDWEVLAERVAAVYHRVVGIQP